ncbi:hypothetical protein WAH92_21355, partial [Acinetobacter baumannii]
IDTDPAQIGKRYATDIGLAGDADKTLRWLIENVEEHTDHSFLEHHQEMMKKWEEKLHDQEEDSSIPIKPQRVMHALQQVAHDDAILSVDVG